MNYGRYNDYGNCHRLIIRLNLLQLSASAGPADWNVIMSIVLGLLSMPAPLLQRPCSLYWWLYAIHPSPPSTAPNKAFLHWQRFKWKGKLIDKLTNHSGSLVKEVKLSMFRLLLISRILNPPGQRSTDFIQDTQDFYLQTPPGKLRLTEVTSSKTRGHYCGAQGTWCSHHGLPTVSPLGNMF